MRKLLKKYLAITKSASGDIVIEDNKSLKESVGSGNLGKYLFDTYGIIKIMFAEPGYMQYKFIFDCKTEEFKLVRYPKGTKQFSLTKSEKQKRMYDIIMDKALGENGWVFKNMFLKFDISKVESLKEKAPKLKVVTEVSEDSKEVGKENAEEVERNEGNLIFGDSQIVGNIGKSIQSRFGGYREGKSSTTADYWKDQVTSGGIGEYVAKKPKNIFMLLGGNGAAGIKDLLDEIYKISPNSKINFISLPSPAKATGLESKYKAVFGRGKKEYDYRSLYEQRFENFTSSSDQVSASIPYSKGKAQFIDIFNIEWTCEEECDGIHVTPDAAEKIVSKIKIKESAEPLVG